MSELAQALLRANISVIKFDPRKKRCIRLNDGSDVDFVKLAKTLRDRLAVTISEYPEVSHASKHDMAKFESLAREHIQETLELEVERTPAIVEGLEDLQLYIDPTVPGGRGFYLAQSNGKYSEIDGEYYLRANGLKEPEAMAMAITAIRSYQPRKRVGTFKSVSTSGESLVYFNTYLPPTWTECAEKVPDELPALFKKLIESLFPLEAEQRFFLSWLRETLVGRAPTYLILCGAPGSGKNRMKLVIRALHGHANSVDGKKSTLSGNFNGPLFDNTFQSFDELKIDSQMKHVMKEILNGSASKERKGVDATRGEDIHSSMMIMNNRPRDNYIEFEDRKFVPLVISKHNLREKMTEEEIKNLTEKVEDPRHRKFDPLFLKQIAEWVIKHGFAKQWSSLEYKGPMFYRLAHTSMSKWQKRYAMMILDSDQRKGPGDSKIEILGAVGFKWSTVETFYFKKNKISQTSRDNPDATTVKEFFDRFCDASGNKVFKTKSVDGDIMNDFWVKQIRDEVRILSEDDIAKEDLENGKANEESDGTELL